MDLLGSILGSMTGPPTASEKEKAERKKAKALAQKMEEKQRQESKAFRTKLEEKLAVFSSGNERCLELGVMTKYQRSVVHDIAEVAGIIAHSFGMEDEERHCMLWKKEDPPCEDELACLKEGRAWNPDENERLKQEKLKQDILEEKETKERIKQNKKFVPKTNYRDKYQHLISAETTVAAPSQVNKSFGLVSAEEKKDRRTMEQIQADIKAKRKAKEQLEGVGPTDSKISKLS